MEEKAHSSLQVISFTQIFDEKKNTFCLELGTALDCVHSVTSLQLADNKVEIWCGQSQGQVAIFCLTESVVTNQDIVTHTLLEAHEVMRVVSTEDNKHVFTYLYPGCVIYQW